ncbi:hypothetical protein [Nocardia jiangxiensis]|uniref:DUF3592 domain-containing protein n=1 Tax=Nocardia jiangxiensis TaxID=282685 RepID=A0ABW6S797_9NOCA|nr:hypothetical protein [Nocardia jiangxiensis]
MRLHRQRKPLSRRPVRQQPVEKPLGRAVVVLLGLSVIAVAIAGAADPYRQTRQFNSVMTCEPDGADCFASQTVSIVDRWTYTTSSDTVTTVNGQTSWTTTTTTHYELALQWPDGTRRTHEINSRPLYNKAHEGRAAVVKLWHNEIVGITMAGDTDWDVPHCALILAGWLYPAFLGLGIVLWGLLFRTWDGFSTVAIRGFGWMFFGILPVGGMAIALALSLHSDRSVTIATTIFLTIAVGAGVWTIRFTKPW